MPLWIENQKVNDTQPLVLLKISIDISILSERQKLACVTVNQHCDES